MQGWYYVESLRQRHDRVQTESQIATVDSCFNLVGSLQHGVAGCEVFSWSTDINKPTICWLIRSFTDPTYTRKHFRLQSFASLCSAVVNLVPRISLLFMHLLEREEGSWKWGCAVSFSNHLKLTQELLTVWHTLKRFAWSFTFVICNSRVNLLRP